MLVTVHVTRVYAVDTIPEPIAIADQSLIPITQWFPNDKLSLNISKTKALMLGTLNNFF